MQNLEHSDVSDKNLGQTTTDAVVQSQHDYMLVRICQKAYVKVRHSAYQLDIGAGAFERVFITHRNAVTTAVKRMLRTSECDRRGREETLKEGLERNVTLCLHNSFCRNRETYVDPLPSCKQRVEEQNCWSIACNSVRLATDKLQDTEAESAESVLQEEEMEQ